MLTIKILSIHLKKNIPTKHYLQFLSLKKKEKKNIKKHLILISFFEKKKKDLKSANEVLVLIHVMVLAYCSPFLMAISCAKRL